MEQEGTSKAPLLQHHLGGHGREGELTISSLDCPHFSSLREHVKDCKSLAKTHFPFEEGGISIREEEQGGSPEARWWGFCKWEDFSSTAGSCSSSSPVRKKGKDLGGKWRPEVMAFRCACRERLSWKHQALFLINCNVRRQTFCPRTLLGWWQDVGLLSH